MHSNRYNTVRLTVSESFQPLQSADYLLILDRTDGQKSNLTPFIPTFTTPFQTINRIQTPVRDEHITTIERRHDPIKHIIEFVLHMNKRPG